MKKFFLTVYDKTGKHLVNDVFEANDESAAKEEGKKRLAEQNYTEHTNRLVNSSGRLLLFHA